MLLEIKVSNFAIIENLSLSFKSGLNILSGETGSGKSVLLKSLGLLMGQKSSAESIRTGFKQATIEGSFDLSHRKDLIHKLEEMGIPVEDQILVVRRVLTEDKSRIYLNGSLSTLNDLRDIVSPLIEVAGQSAPLIEMTGQHENKNLLSKNYHLDILDQYAGTIDLRRGYLEKFSLYKKLKNEMDEINKNEGQRAQRIDFLVYQKNEIADLDLSPGEDIEIEQALKTLKGSSKISQFVDASEEALYTDDDSSVNRVASVLKKSSDITSLAPQLSTSFEKLAQAKELIADAVFEIRNHFSKLDTDPAEIEKLEERLSRIRRLQKKYGSSVNDIIEALVSIENELAGLENAENRITEIQNEMASIEKELIKIAGNLFKRRSEGAKLLESSVNAELLDLNMKGVTFHVHLEKINEFSSSAGSQAEFLSQTSPKDSPKSLAKFASGGELSRILLSLKRVAGQGLQPRTYLFDEVDAGVSGETAERVGKKLHSIAKGQQVICVTHLPQVAACGDVHFSIQKSSTNSAVAIEVTELKTKDRIKEIARLISGEKITKTSLAHAEELLKASL